MIGKKFFVFTNWGLVRATVVKERVDESYGLTQYKVKVDINRVNKGKDYGFWFNEDQLHKFYGFALLKELVKLILNK